MHITQNTDNAKSSVTINSDGGCSPPRKKRIQNKEKQKKQKNTSKQIERSDNETLQSEEEDKRRIGNKRVRRSADFQQAIKISLADSGDNDNFSKWFIATSSSGRGSTYQAEITETIKCCCEFFDKKRHPVNI